MEFYYFLIVCLDHEYYMMGYLKVTNLGLKTFRRESDLR